MTAHRGLTVIPHRNPDHTFIETVCPISQVKTYISPDWTDIPLTQDYTVTFHRISTHILSAYPKGRISYEGTRELFKKYDQFLVASNLSGHPYVEISDYSQIVNMPSKRGRVKVAALLREKMELNQLKGHFIYNVPNYIKWMYNIGIRLEQPGIPMKALGNYDEALDKALNLRWGNKKNRRFFKQIWAKFSHGKTSSRYSEDLLDYIGHINWDEKGFQAETIPQSHPFKSIFDAIALLKADHDQTISEREKIQKKYKGLFNHIADPILVFDQETDKILDCNHAFLNVYGYTRDELRQMTPKDLHQEQELERLKKNFSNDHTDHRYTHLTKNGTAIDVEVMTDETEYQGRQAWISNIRDITNQNRLETELRKHRDALGFLVKERTQALEEEITQRKQSEEALRQSEENYRGMIQNMQDVFFRTDMTQALTMISPSALKLLGYEKVTDLLGQKIGDLFFKNTPAFERFSFLMKEKGMVSNFELILFTRNNEKIPVISSSKYFTDALGTPMGIEGTITNIREQKEASEILMQAKRQAESAAKTKSEFLANMSHEIRTPMNAILGMGELILETQMNDYQKNLVTTINNESTSLLGIINSILDYSKAESGRLELEQAPFNLRVLCEDLAASFAITAHKKGLEFISFLPPNIPEQLEGDPGRLRQILVNLIGNAIKFTPKGEIFIWVDTLAQKNGTITLRFNVKDTGIGIPTDKQDYIFESFAQADGSTTRKFGGTGLGTTISKQLVQMMGGKIGLDSNSETGTTFWFTLSFKLDQSPPVILQDIESNLKEKQILIVGNNPKNRFVFASFLTALGCVPVEAETGKDALSRLSSFPGTRFDLMLTDIQMPGMDGFQLTKEARQIPGLDKLPVIILTSMGKLGDNRKCRDLDIQGYLIKPVKQNALKTAITAVLNSDRIKSAPPLTRHRMAEINRKVIQVLLVEDYPANQQVAVRHLMSHGFQVNLAKNGQQAVDLFKAKHFNLILMDIQMPVMDGYEATRQIRAHEQKTKKAFCFANPDKAHLFKRTPIIAMTAHSAEGYREKSLAEDMDDFLAKPLQKTSFLKMVDAYVLENSPRATPNGSDGFTESTGPVAPEGETPSNAPGTLPPISTYLPLDLKTALYEFDNDKPFFMEVLNEFLDTLAPQIMVMENALALPDFQRLQENSHSIKGGAANLTAMDLSRAAAAMEEISKFHQKKNLRSAMDQLLFEFARVKEYSLDI